MDNLSRFQQRLLRQQLFLLTACFRHWLWFLHDFSSFVSLFSALISGVSLLVCLCVFQMFGLSHAWRAICSDIALWTDSDTVKTFPRSARESAPQRVYVTRPQFWGLFLASVFCRGPWRSVPGDPSFAWGFLTLSIALLPHSYLWGLWEWSIVGRSTVLLSERAVVSVHCLPPSNLLMLPPQKSTSYP